MVAHGSSQSVTAFDAKNRLGRLLDRVQAGEEVVITRHGQPVARLVPIGKHKAGDLERALETFRRVRDSLSAAGTRVSRDDVRAWRSEGRK